MVPSATPLSEFNRIWICGLQFIVKEITISNKIEKDDCQHSTKLFSSQAAAPKIKVK